MPSLVINGAQWGDEGKGKLADYFTGNADWVVRYQGGNNAGHTLVIGGVKTKLQLVPCGIMRPQCRCIIGAGVVADPGVLLDEIERLRAAGAIITPDRLTIDHEAHVVLDYHPILDKAREEFLGTQKIGTTGRGIGPAYEDRAARCGIRYADLLAPRQLFDRVANLVESKNRYLQYVLLSKEKISFESVWNRIEVFTEKVRPFIGNGSLLLDKALKAGERVVFEGAQATMLDMTFGTFPYVTACNTVSGAVCTGAGIGPKRIDYVLGVVKAYCTRVGSGPFPSELTDARGDFIREKGIEFGTVTGRSRRCGWFDAAAVRRAVRLNGYDSLAVMKLDVLSGLPKVSICTGYTLDGKELEDVPPIASEFERVEPKLVELEGWTEPIEDRKSYADLPSAAKMYLEALSDYAGCRVSMVSVGPERNATFFVDSEPFLGGFMSDAVGLLK